MNPLAKVTKLFRGSAKLKPMFQVTPPHTCLQRASPSYREEKGGVEVGENTRKRLGGGVGKEVVGQGVQPSPSALGFRKPTGPGFGA